MQHSYLQKFMNGDKTFYVYDRGKFKGFISNCNSEAEPYISDGFSKQDLRCILEALIGEEIFP